MTINDSLHTINNAIVTTDAAGSYTDEQHASATVPGQVNT
jgi:hypothetical protein